MKRAGPPHANPIQDGEEPPIDMILRVIAEHGFSTTAYFRTNTCRRRQHWLPDAIHRTMTALVHQRQFRRVVLGERSRYELPIDLHGTIVIVIVDEREASIHNIHFKDYL
ncbi:MAG: hypothetical protein H7287_02650 [Thermoleophilia bacterium]|nr:hypothetical protein [Thermoleophilia bacterium]